MNLLQHFLRRAAQHRYLIKDTRPALFFSRVVNIVAIGRESEEAHGQAICVLNDLQCAAGCDCFRPKAVLSILPLDISDELSVGRDGRFNGVTNRCQSSELQFLEMGIAFMRRRKTVDAISERAEDSEQNCKADERAQFVSSDFVDEVLCAQPTPK